MTDDQAPDLSPALGGSRAIPDEPILSGGDDLEAAQAARTAARASASAAAGAGLIGDPLFAELSEILGEEGQEVLQALNQFGSFGQELSSIFANTLQSLETHLPQAIAAFGGLLEAVEQVVDQALEPSPDPDDEA